MMKWVLKNFNGHAYIEFSLIENSIPVIKFASGCQYVGFSGLRTFERNVRNKYKPDSSQYQTYIAALNFLRAATPPLPKIEGKTLPEIMKTRYDYAVKKNELFSEEEYIQKNELFLTIAKNTPSSEQFKYFNGCEQCYKNISCSQCKRESYERLIDYYRQYPSYCSRVFGEGFELYYDFVAISKDEQNLVIPVPVFCDLLELDFEFEKVLKQFSQEQFCSMENLNQFLKEESKV